MNRDKLHLLHIRDSIEKIEKYSKNITFEKFAKGELEYDAILMQVVVIGEAVHELSEEFKEEHSQMPWHQAVSLRNRTAHGYLDIKPEIIWQTIKEDLPKLKKQIKKLI